MGRPRLNVERMTVHLSPGARLRVAALVGTYGMSEFIRTAVEAELDRREQGRTTTRTAGHSAQESRKDDVDTLQPAPEQENSAQPEPSTITRRRGVITHGHGGKQGQASKTYAAWRSMKERCDLPSQASYRYCGA